MTETTEKTSPKLSKKEARKIVYEKFSNALAEYKANLKEKKFDTKLFAADIAKAVAKQKQQIKKPAKIKAVKNDLPDQGAAEAAV
jgi:predicted AAA+ superfamily ATPase